jgi:prepilin-type N-terminal cleavage/methylation domain-containing protein
MRKDSGFSLIELFIVIALIGIIAAIATPNFSRWVSNYRLKSAAMDLYTHMQFTKVNAVKNNKQWAIVFDPDNSKYSICSDEGADKAWGSGDDEIVREVHLSSYKSGVAYGHGNATTNATQGGGSFPAEDISYTSNVVWFNSRGLADNGYVYLENDLGESYAIGSIISGVVYSKRWTGSNWE